MCHPVLGQQCTREENLLNLRGLPEIGSEFMLISRDPKCHCALVKMEVCGYQIISGAWTQVLLMLDATGLHTSLAVMSQVPEFTKKTDIISNWQNPLLDTQTCGVKTMVGRTRLPFPTMVVNQGHCHVSGGTGKISSTTAYIKDGCDSYHIPLILRRVRSCQSIILIFSKSK